ncbi:MAG: hypothetical protein LBN04_02355 [Oscillospiraceae bacterium]|nr:hypothetical protein [Oscillospiraceae bacterium]
MLVNPVVVATSWGEDDAEGGHAMRTLTLIDCPFVLLGCRVDEYVHKRCCVAIRHLTLGADAIIERRQ